MVPGRLWLVQVKPGEGRRRCIFRWQETVGVPTERQSRRWLGEEWKRAVAAQERGEWHMVFDMLVWWRCSNDDGTLSLAVVVEGSE